MSPRKSKDEMDADKEKKRKRREEKRAVKRANERKNEDGKDILDIGRSHFSQENAGLHHPTSPPWCGVTVILDSSGGLTHRCLSR